MQTPRLVIISIGLTKPAVPGTFPHMPQGQRRADGHVGGERLPKLGRLQIALRGPRRAAVIGEVAYGCLFWM